MTASSDAGNLNNNPDGIPEATQMDKRVEGMPDGRYMIYYTFPNIDRDVKSFGAASHPGGERKQNASSQGIVPQKNT